MTNTIKLKRGSGSDPSASDMVVGEPVLRSDTAELFFKKDDGSVAKVSGGGGGGSSFQYLALRNAANDGAASYPGNDFTLVTSGTTTAVSPATANALILSYGGVVQKPNSGTSTSGITGFIVDGSRLKTATNFAAAPDFIVYQESGGIGTPSDNTITSAKIVDGAIVNADINASAAIAGTKISPDFGSQTIATTGVTNLSAELRANGNIKITNAGPKITFTDSGHNPDYIIQNADGALIFNDATNAANRLVINTDGHVDVTGNLDVGAGLDVTGNITATGIINLGVADTSSGHINAAELMTFNIDTDNDDTNRYFGFYKNGLSSSGNELFRIQEDGNVGIGTTPSYKLHVAEGTTDVVASFTSSDANAWIQFRDDHTNDTAVMIGANDDSMMLRAGSNTRMLIAHNGNVGIGTDSPKSFSTQTSLTINGSAVGRFDCIAGGGGGGGIYGTATSTKVFANSGATLYLDTAASTDLRLSVNGTEIAKAKNNKDFEIVDGNLVVASGHGINFYNYGAGTMQSSNLLDDYEEGEYVPGTSANLTLNSSYSKWAYTKIGRQVTIKGLFLCSAVSGTDAIEVNIPFTAANFSNSAGMGGGNATMFSKVTGATAGVASYIQNSGTAMRFYILAEGTGGWTRMANNDISTNTEIYVTHTYFTP